MCMCVCVMCVMCVYVLCVYLLCYVCVCVMCVFAYWVWSVMRRYNIIIYEARKFFERLIDTPDTQTAELVGRVTYAVTCSMNKPHE